MEDLIYVLLGLVWVVFSVINARKKKQTPAPNTLPKSDLEEMFEEFFPPKRTPVATKHFTEEEAETLETITIDEAEQGLETLQPMGAYNAYTGDWIEEEETVSVEERSEITILDDVIAAGGIGSSAVTQKAKKAFNIKEAFIYQTILQRPQY